MWTRYRFDNEPLLGIDLTSVSPVTTPLVANGESLLLNGSPFRLHGLLMTGQSFGNMSCTPDKSSVDDALNSLVKYGINSICLMEFDAVSVVPSGSLAGRQSGCWSDASATAYVDAFWSGDVAGACGWDYFWKACTERGLYISLRFDQWGLVMQNRGFTAPNGSANSKWIGLWWFDGTNGTPNVKQAVKDHMAVFLNRVNKYTGRTYGSEYTLFSINPFNEMGVYQFYYNTSNISSPTSSTFDKMVQTGGSPNSTYVAAIDAKFVAWHTATFGSGPTYGGTPITYMPTYAYTSTTGSGIADRSAKSFKSNVGAASTTEPYYTERMRIAQFWEELERDLNTELRDYLKTLSPHHLYSAGQSGYIGHYAGSVSDILDVHCYHYPSDGSLVRNGNWQTTTATSMSWAAGTLTVTGISGIDTTHGLVVGQPVRVVKDNTYTSANVSRWRPNKAFSTGNFCLTNDNRVYKATTGGTTAATGAGPIGTGASIADGTVTWAYIWSEQVTIATQATTQFTATSSDPAYSGTCSVVLPAHAVNYSALHANFASDTANTRVHANVNGTMQNVDFTGSASGDATSLGSIYSITFRKGTTLTNKPAMCTETGVNGLSVLGHCQHWFLVNLYGLLQNTSGFYWFCFINATWPMQAGGDHNFQANNYWLMAEIITLMNRYGGISKLTTEDKTVATLPILYDHYAKADNISGYQPTPGYSALVSTLELAGEDGQYWSYIHARLRYDIQSVAAQTNVTYALAGAGQTAGDKTNAAVCKVLVHRNTGYITVETPTFHMVLGRIPGAGLTLNKMQVSVKDGFHWYGVVVWASEDGLALGIGKSRVYTFCYPRDENQQFAMLTTTRQHLLDQGYSSSLSAEVQPGFVLRDGLEVKLAMTSGQGVYQQVNGVTQQLVAPGDSFSGGFLYVQPQHPRLLVR